MYLLRCDMMFLQKKVLISDQSGTCIAHRRKNNLKNIRIAVTGNPGKTINAVSINIQSEKIVFDA